MPRPKKPSGSTALDLFTSGTRWTDATTRALLPFVIQRAMWRHEPTQYNELNAQAVSLGRKTAL
jgi:hypothetical protein